MTRTQRAVFDIVDPDEPTDRYEVQASFARDDYGMPYVDTLRVYRYLPGSKPRSVPFIPPDAFRDWLELRALDHLATYG